MLLGELNTQATRSLYFTYFYHTVALSLNLTLAHLHIYTTLDNVTLCIVVSRELAEKIFVHRLHP